MIWVAGNSFDISQFISEYGDNSVEADILHTMNNSDQTYNFDSKNQLKFELDLRREIVKSAIDLNRSDFSFAVFHQSKCNPNYWDRTDNGGFRLKEDANSAEAINDIFTNSREYTTECATAMVIVYYKALLNVFGEELFGLEFNNIYLMNWHNIDKRLREIGSPKDVADILLGDRCYFKNPDVNPETPEWQGENVIVLPNNLYYGHGMGIKNAERIIDALNANRKPDATEYAYLMNQAGRPNFKGLFKIYNKEEVPVFTTLYWKPFPTAL